MKNIHILQTDKPSRLGRFIDTNNLFIRVSNDIPRGENVNIYITNSEEIKERDWVIALDINIVFKCNKYEAAQPIKQFKDIYKKIILTTDQSLNGVQAIDNEFLNWFVKNPSCENVEVKSESSRKHGMWKPEYYPQIYKIIIPKEENSIEAKQRAKNYMSLKGALEPKQETLEEAAKEFWDKLSFGDAFEAGAKWQQERMYSEEDMKLAFETGRNFQLTGEDNFNELIEQFKKK